MSGLDCSVVSSLQAPRKSSVSSRAQPLRVQLVNSRRLLATCLLAPKAEDIQVFQWRHKEAVMRASAWAIAVLTLFLTCTAVQAAQDSWEDLRQLQAGQKIQIVDMNLKSLKGRFVGLLGESISLRTRKKGDVTIERAKVFRVTDLQRSKRGRKALLGLLIGGATGAGIGAAKSSDVPAPLGALIVFGWFGGMGAGLGALAPSHSTIYRAKQRLDKVGNDGRGRLAEGGGDAKSGTRDPGNRAGSDSEPGADSEGFLGQPEATPGEGKDQGCGHEIEVLDRQLRERFGGGARRSHPARTGECRAAQRSPRDQRRKIKAQAKCNHRLCDWCRCWRESADRRRRHI